MSDQTIPNYIFIKENFRIGDELLFISSRKMEPKIDWIVSTLDYVNCQIKTIILDINDEERWDEMIRKITNRLDAKNDYIVNLTCGTKYMSAAVQKVFELFKSEFYYIPFPKNEILMFGKENNPIYLNFRVGIAEYMKLHNVKYKNKTQIIDKDYTDKFFSYFIERKFSAAEWEVISLLRQYRDLEKVGNNYRLSRKIEISTVEAGLQKSKKSFSGIKDLSQFLKTIDFPLKEKGNIYESEIQFLTGGWFEEYVFNMIIEKIKPTEIVLGVDIDQNEYTNKNDLDVVFTYGNKLFVIECKTGISKTEFKGEEAMFKEIAYKAATIKGTLLGLPGNSFICSLSDGNEKFKTTAKKMGINYYDRSYFIEEIKINQLISDIKFIAKDSSSHAN